MDTCIFVGPGTGVAPFRSFLSEIMPDLNVNDETFLLFFGCRNKSADFYFENEWNRFSDHFRIFTAFSRDQERKNYVQHEIEKQSQLVADLVVNQRARVFIAGNAKQMPDSVKSALKDCLVKHNFVEKENVDQFLSQMEKERRLQLETWS